MAVIRLYAEENFGPIDETDMLSAEYQDDYQQPVCFVDRINDFNKIDNSIESLRTFMDVDQPEHDDININMHNNYLAKSQNLESNPIIVRKKSKPRGPYRRYTSNQIERLFDLVIEEAKTAKEAALITGINIRTAQHYIKKYNDDEERCLPGGCSKPRVRNLGKLTDAHSHFLMEYIDMHPTAVLADIRDKLCQTF